VRHGGLGFYGLVILGRFILMKTKKAAAIAAIIAKDPTADSGATCMKPAMLMLVDTVRFKAGPSPSRFWAVLVWFVRSMYSCGHTL